MKGRGGPGVPMREAMRRHDGPCDVVIVGAGAGGSTLAKALAEGGLAVVVLEAGEWFDARKDWANDEPTMRSRITWEERRTVAGNHPLAFGAPNTGRGIGGSTLHFTALKLRLHPDDFDVRTRDGVGADWPFGYDELAPFYEEAERFVGTSGPRDMPTDGPWAGNPPRYGQGELPLNAGDELIAAGMEKLGVRWRMAPHAVLTAPKDGRSPCMNYGFCVQGCKSDAKGAANVTWVPAAVRAGAEFRDRARALRIEHDAQGRATGVTYVREGREAFQAAKLVVVACYSIETPRLLLNSASSLFPDGLGNGGGQVGRNLMVHPATIGFGRFDRPLDNFVTPPVGILSQDPYGTQRGRAFPRGYMVNRYAMMPIEFASTLTKADPELWGASLHAVMDAYPRWTLLTSQNEMLPRSTNRVELADEKDALGVPVARVHLDYDENDLAMKAHAQAFVGGILQAAGAEEVRWGDADYHVLGTCRMGRDAADSVVDSELRVHGTPNLMIVDGSVFPTIGAVNPSLTIEALALRAGRSILRG